MGIRDAAAFALACLLAGPGAAQGADPIDAVRALLRAAGAEHRFEEWPELLEPIRTRADERLDPEASALLLRTVAELDSPRALREAVVARLAREDPGRVSELLEAWRAPREAELVALERRATTAAGLRDFPLFVADLREMRLSKARNTSLVRLERAGADTESVMLVAGGVSRGLLSGMAALGCAPDELPELERSEQERLASLTTLVRKRIRIRMLYAWRDVATLELARHAAFLESDASWLFDELNAGVEEGLAAAADRLRERLAPVVRERCAERQPDPAATAEPASSPGRGSRSYI